jgi:hypothetical protein
MENNSLFGEVISSYTSQEAAEDGVLVPVTKQDAVTRSVWEYLAAKAPKTSKPPCNWPVEMMGWFSADSIKKEDALRMIAEHGKDGAQEKFSQMIADNKALALARGLIGRDSRTAKRVYENNEGGGIHKVNVADTATEIVGLVERELPGGTRTLWLIPNELGGVTLMFPEDY